jgi:hypothetical protein
MAPTQESELRVSNPQEATIMGAEYGPPYGPIPENVDLEFPGELVSMPDLNNRQVALLAAAVVFGGAGGVIKSHVKALAEDFEGWLDRDQAK